MVAKRFYRPIERAKKVETVNSLNSLLNVLQQAGNSATLFELYAHRMFV